MEWTIFNEGKPLKSIVDGIECTICEYDYTDEQISVFKEINSHIIEISTHNQKYHTEERRLRLADYAKSIGITGWDYIQYGYVIIMRQDGTISEINLDCQGLGWGETEDLLGDITTNKDEIEFVKKIVSVIKY